jgi:hypothetical protein
MLDGVIALIGSDFFAGVLFGCFAAGEFWYLFGRKKD